MAYFKCPHCGSENIQKCSIIYNSGTASHQSTTTINGNVEAETSGVSGTNLAQQLAPPAKKDEEWIASVVCGLIALFFADALTDTHHFFLVLVITVVFGLFAIILWMMSSENQKYNENQFPIDYDVWTRSYFCHRCGNVFYMK